MLLLHTKEQVLILFKIGRFVEKFSSLSMAEEHKKNPLPHTHPPHNYIDRRETCITYMYVGVGRGKLKRPHGVLSFLPLGMYVNSKHPSHTHTHTHTLSLFPRENPPGESMVSYPLFLHGNRLLYIIAGNLSTLSVYHSWGTGGRLGETDFY